MLILFFKIFFYLLIFCFKTFFYLLIFFKNFFFIVGFIFLKIFFIVDFFFVIILFPDVISFFFDPFYLFIFYFWPFFVIFDFFFINSFNCFKIEIIGWTNKSSWSLCDALVAILFTKLEGHFIHRFSPEVKIPISEKSEKYLFWLIFFFFFFENRDFLNSVCTDIIHLHHKKLDYYKGKKKKNLSTKKWSQKKNLEIWRFGDLNTWTCFLRICCCCCWFFFL